MNKKILVAFISVLVIAHIVIIVSKYQEIKYVKYWSNQIDYRTDTLLSIIHSQDSIYVYMATMKRDIDSLKAVRK